MSKEQFETFMDKKIAEMSPEEKAQMEQDMANVVEDKLREEAEDMEVTDEDNS